MSEIETRLAALEKFATSFEEKVLPAIQALSKPADGSKALEAAANEEKAKVADEKKSINLNTKYPRGGEEKFLLVRAIKAMSEVKNYGYDGAWSRFAPYEKAAMDAAVKEMQFKDGAEGTGAGLAGTPASTYGFLVPPQFITDLIEVIRAKTVVRAMGCRTLPAASNVGFIPRQSGAATAAWISEAGSITASDLTFQQVQYTVRKLAAYVVLSNELIADADPAVDAIVRQDVAAVIALQEDLTALQGSGSAPTPTGVKNQSGVGSTPSMGTNGSTPTFDTIISAERQIVTSNRQPTGWALHPRTITTLTKIKDSSGRYIWEPAPYLANVVPAQSASGDYAALGNPNANPARPSGTLRGIPVFETTQVPINNTVGSSTNCSDLYVGQWDELIIIERGGMEFAVSDQILFQNYQTAVRALVRRDMIVRHAAAFDVVTGILP